MPQDKVPKPAATVPQVQITSRNNLLMKVANTGGRIRAIPWNAVRGAMENAWVRSYGAISQVATNLFMAHFEDSNAMWFVFRKQPRSVEKETILIEWVDPEDRSKPMEDYRFEALYVTVKIYGIPCSL